VDLQATSQLLGNFGEFFGAIAVVATLIYLAGQLRQNTNALRSASYEHWNEISNSFQDFLAQHRAELSEIEKHDNLEELTADQLKLWAALGGKAINQAQCAFLQHRAGTLDDDVFETRIASFLNWVDETPMMREAWSLYSRKHYSAAFADFIDIKLRDS
jgi:hypothetical protein